MTRSHLRRPDNDQKHAAEGSKRYPPEPLPYILTGGHAYI
jgi:hypothetical protein